MALDIKISSYTQTACLESFGFAQKESRGTQCLEVLAVIREMLRALDTLP